MDRYDAIRGKSVLIVDDNELITSLLADALARCGAMPVRSHSGQAGLELLAGRHFDLLLLDVRMGGMGGWDMLNEIKRRQPGMLDKTVIITGDGFRTNTTWEIAGQTLPVLHKPFNLETLRTQARKVLQKNLQKTSQTASPVSLVAA